MIQGDCILLYKVEGVHRRPRVIFRALLLSAPERTTPWYPRQETRKVPTRTVLRKTAKEEQAEKGEGEEKEEEEEKY